MSGAFRGAGFRVVSLPLSLFLKTLPDCSMHGLELIGVIHWRGTGTIAHTWCVASLCSCQAVTDHWVQAPELVDLFPIRCLAHTRITESAWQQWPLYLRCLRPTPFATN